MPPRKSTIEDVKEEVAKDLAEEQIHKNMRFYGKCQDTPQEARKEIGAGRLKGYTDINPMWRIKRLTEMFGPVGFGWWTQNEKFTFQECSNEEVAVFCELELVVVDPESDAQSHPIKGFGGNKFLVNESKGKYCNDEAMKMAYTDALSIACKSLGFSHDIYYSKDRTKYSLPEEILNDTASNNEPTPEDYKAITDRIQKGISLVTKDMDKEAKEKFSKDVIVKHIGGPNYMTCKDMSKLNALLNELLSMAKKSA